MSLGLLLSLAGLALVDSTSIGTLFIPIWLLLAPGRVSVRRILVYLGTIAAFYFAVGLVLVWAAPGWPRRSAARSTTARCCGRSSCSAWACSC